MFFDKVELVLRGGLPREKLADRAQTIGPVGQCRLARSFQSLGLVFGGQCFQANQDADAFHATSLDHRPRPITRVRSDRRDLPQQRIGAAFNGGHFLFGDVIGRSAEAAWFRFGVNRDLFPTFVEHAH